MIGRRQSSDLGQRLASFETALDLADGRVDQAVVLAGRQVTAKAGDRLRHGTDHTLVALLGATGGGKSSLTNALTGTTVATTGVRRPTTSTTLACYWGDTDPEPLLEWLEVPNRHRVAGSGSALDGLILLDVPDHDSVELTNRQEMERIAELTDLMLWVTDAEKYADKAMHAYLHRLHHHGGVIAMALNKSDLLHPDDVERCRRDLIDLLAADGIANASVIAVSARSGRGVDELQALLARTVQARQAMIQRLSADVATAASDLLAEIGGADGHDEVPGRVARDLAGELVAGSGLGPVADAVAAGHRRDAAARTGWPFTRWVRSLRPHPLRRFHLGRGSDGRASLPRPSGVQRARTDAAVRNVVRSVTDELPDPWPDLIREAATPNPEVLADRVDKAVADVVRQETATGPRWWGAVNALQVVLALAAVVGLGWLGLLAVAGYFRLPEVPTPSIGAFPVPTTLALGGIVVGWVLALVAGRLASVGATRRRRAVQRRAERAVEAVATELVVTPLNSELRRRGELRRALLDAGAEAAPAEGQRRAVGGRR